MARDADTSDGKLREMSDTAVSPPLSGSMNRQAERGRETLTSDGSRDILVAEEPEDEASGIHDDKDSVDDGVGSESETDAPPEKRPKSQIRLTAVALTVVAGLAALVGWLGFVSHKSSQDQHQRELFLQVGRQGALNLTTIDWEHADSDVQRILDSTTGQFYDDFSKRFQPFIDVLKRAKSKSIGTVTEAGLESKSGDEAQVLVAVRIDTSNLSAAEQEPRHWRMRISVVKVGDEFKVSNVAFVS